MDLGESPVPSNRLTFDDDLFLRSRRVLGIPLVNQTVWRLDTPPDRGELARIHAGLASGPLTRRVARSLVPGARDRWIPSTVTSPLEVAEEPVGPDDILGWADRQAAVDLDPEQGPTWALSAAPTVDGGSVLSYVTSHAVCDGGAHVGSLIAAVAGRTVRRLPVDDPGPRGTRLGDDLGDALHQCARTARGLLEAWRLSREPVTPADVQKSADFAPRAPRDGDDVPHSPSTVVLDCDAVAWERVAHTHGGTPNTLLIAIVVEVLLASGRAGAGRPVQVALPVSLRGEDDLRSNATSAVSIAVPTEDVAGTGRVQDLAAVRRASRDQFSALAAGSRRDALKPWKPLLQLLPDAAVRRLASGSATPLCLCSNLGALDPHFAAPTGSIPTSVLMRSVPQGASRNQLRRTRGGLSAWWSRHGDVATLCLVGLDPDHFPDTGTLRRTAVEALQRWGIEPRPW